MTTPNKQRLYDKVYRNKEAKAFYNSQLWKDCRQAALSRDTHLCQDCLTNGHITSADMVHHIIELMDDKSKSLDVDNLISLCWTCHNVHHPDRWFQKRKKKKKEEKKKKINVVTMKKNKDQY